MKCNKCNKTAIFGGGENARCFEHLDENLKGSTYRDYHTPVKKKSKAKVIKAKKSK